MVYAQINYNEIDDSFDCLDKNELAAANIMPQTGFATDYLNVFNEAVMLFGLLGDMPDMIEELRAWEPLHYIEHFKRSNFQAKEMAISVFKLIPISRRAPFEDLSQTLGQMIKDAIVEAETLIKVGGDINDFASETCIALQSIIMMLDGMIHGTASHDAQDDVDALFD